MSSGITLYTPPATIRSTLLKNPTDTIPSTEELEALQAELKQLRQRTLERAKKAGDDLKTIEESMRRLKEREKGKGKAVDKIKKERAFTPLANGDGGRLSAQPQHPPKSRLPSMPVGSIQSGTPTPSYDSRRAMEEAKKKKKNKRKREETSDVEPEERGHGPLTERLVSALIPMQNATEWKGVKAAEEAMEGRPGTNGAAAQAARDKLNVADLEDRVRNVMRFHGLLDEIPDYSEAVDDPIATALRHAQRELRTVVATNKARRARLTAIARDRLAYQEYLDGRDALDKNIANLYAKLQKKDGPKANKKKKKLVEQPGTTNGAGAAGLPVPSPAALGLIQDEEQQLSVPDQLKSLVQTRRQWVDMLGSIFSQKEEEAPGRIWGLSKRSVYEGVDEEVRQELERIAPPSKRSRTSPNHDSATSGRLDTHVQFPGASNKGKARARVDDMAMELG
ncbi:hypothetical protein EW026_g4517 [Hermanssonia centrifuga]|uniref:Uncharacterized protein n=1 Tax=Hermanssonia centrifuga TaxID=98765 RepID=A0A4S4KIN1_9APHY|nr:hypothetical protein EW026_g4517 [Hermanssonia centrifuga]